MTGRLTDKIAVVVGGGQTPGPTVGNGRATALLFAREGARVLVVDRDQAAAEETCAEVTHEGGDATPFAADITDEAACRSIAAAVRDRFGVLDILHNNVGVWLGDARALRLAEDDWSRIIDTNLKGMWLTCKHLVPLMIASGGGSVINVSSIAAANPAPHKFAYSVSKAGVNALTLNFAVDYARSGVRVNAIMPGLIDTPMAIDDAVKEYGVDRESFVADRHSRVPLRHQMGSAWDVAWTAVFLASDEAGHITGSIVPVDGGLTATGP